MRHSLQILDLISEMHSWNLSLQFKKTIATMWLWAKWMILMVLDGWHYIEMTSWLKHMELSPCPSHQPSNVLDKIEILELRGSKDEDFDPSFWSHEHWNRAINQINRINELKIRNRTLILILQQKCSWNMKKHILIYHLVQFAICIFGGRSCFFAKQQWDWEHSPGHLRWPPFWQCSIW